MIKEPPDDKKMRKVVLKWVYGFKDFITLFVSFEDRKSFQIELIMKYYQKFIDAFDKNSSSPERTRQYESYSDFYLQICWIIKYYKLPKEVFHKTFLAGFDYRRRKTDTTYYVVRADLLQDFLVDLSVYLEKDVPFNFLTYYLMNYEQFEKEHYKIINNKPMYIKDHEDFLIKYWKANPDVKAKQDTMCNILYILDEQFSIIYHK